MDLVNQFKSTTARAERTRIQREVVAAYGPIVRRAVRDLTPAGHQKEAVQVALLGVIVALETYDPAAGVPFEKAAIVGARTEVWRWRSRLAGHAAAPHRSVRYAMEEVASASGREFSIEVKTVDGKPASPAEFSAAFDRAKAILIEPVE